MMAMSRTSSRRGLAGLDTIRVSVGPTTRSTSTTIPTTCSTPERYQPGQRYQPKYSPPTTSASAPALARRWRPKAFNRNGMDSSVALRRPLFRDGVLRRWDALAGDRALPGEPGTEIDQAATLAAERAERRILPVQIALARRTLDACRAHEGNFRDERSGAAAQRERDVALRLGRTRGDAVPREEANAAAMVAAADLGVKARGGGERDAQKLQRVVPLEGDVE